MMKMRYLAAAAAILFAGAALKAAPNLAGIGLSWGVGYQQFDDSRLVGSSQILNIEFKMDKALVLFVHTEQQSVAFDDNGANSDGRIIYNGIGLKYKPSDLVTAGIGLGKADINFNNGAIEETDPYAEIVLGVDLLSGAGEKIAYNLGLTLEYRMVEWQDQVIAGGGRVTQNLNGAQVALGLGVTF